MPLLFCLDVHCHRLLHHERCEHQKVPVNLIIPILLGSSPLWSGKSKVDMRSFDRQSGIKPSLHFGCWCTVFTLASRNVDLSRDPRMPLTLAASYTYHGNAE